MVGADSGAVLGDFCSSPKKWSQVACVYDQFLRRIFPKLALGALHPAQAFNQRYSYSLELLAEHVRLHVRSVEGFQSDGAGVVLVIPCEMRAKRHGWR